MKMDPTATLMQTSMEYATAVRVENCAFNCTPGRSAKNVGTRSDTQWLGCKRRICLAVLERDAQGAAGILPADRSVTHHLVMPARCRQHAQQIPGGSWIRVIRGQ